VQINVSAEAVEYITHDRALRVADELEAEGRRESAAQLRQTAEMAVRFQAYSRP
jgi:hypothetical protein